MSEISICDPLPPIYLLKEKARSFSLKAGACMREVHDLKLRAEEYTRQSEIYLDSVRILQSIKLPVGETK